MISEILNAVWTFSQRILGRSFEFITSLFGWLFQNLFDFLKMIFRPLFIFIALLFYVVYKIAELAIVIIKLFLSLGKLVLAFIKGIFTTLAGFTFIPTTPNQGSWTPIFKNMANGLTYYQLDTLAYVLQFIIWFTVAWAALRILGSIRNGGD